eukprot:9091103-Pyramimonas_sp.AAC.4
MHHLRPLTSRVLTVRRTPSMSAQRVGAFLKPSLTSLKVSPMMAKRTENMTHNSTTGRPYNNR